MFLGFGCLFPVCGQCHCVSYKDAHGILPTKTSRDEYKVNTRVCEKGDGHSAREISLFVDIWVCGDWKRFRLWHENSLSHLHRSASYDGAVFVQSTGPKDWTRRNWLFIYCVFLLILSLPFLFLYPYIFSTQPRWTQSSRHLFNNSSSTWAVPLPALLAREVAHSTTMRPSITVPNIRKCLLGKYPKNVILAH